MISKMMCCLTRQIYSRKNNNHLNHLKELKNIDIIYIFY